MSKFKPKVVTHAGLTLDLSQILAVKQIDTFEGSRNGMIVVYKTRTELILNPATGELIKQEYNETVEHEIPGYESAQTIILEWEEIWQQYLDMHS